MKAKSKEEMLIKIEERKDKFADHVDVEILDMLVNNQHGQLPEDVLNAVLEHISCCLICWAQLKELDD